MYFNVNFNVFFKLIKVHLLVSELYITYHVNHLKSEDGVTQTNSDPSSQETYTETNYLISTRKIMAVGSMDHTKSKNLPLI